MASKITPIDLKVERYYEEGRLPDTFLNEKRASFLEIIEAMAEKVNELIEEVNSGK